MKWEEALIHAEAGTPVRREGWGYWWRKGYALWRLNVPGEDMRIIRATDYSATDLIAWDWTIDPIAEEDVCSRDPASRQFNPPAATVTLSIEGGDVIVRVLLGGGTYGGYRLIFRLNGVQVAVDVAEAPGPYIANAGPDPGGDLFAEVRVESILPLPAWSATPSARLVRLIEYDLSDYFPVIFPGHAFGVPTPYGPGVTFGPFSTTRWVYSVSDDPIGVDDDLEINGVVIEAGMHPYSGGLNGAHFVGGGATTLLKVLPAGTPLVVNVIDNFGGSNSGEGKLRIYGAPL